VSLAQDPEIYVPLDFRKYTTLKGTVILRKINTNMAPARNPYSAFHYTVITNEPAKVGTWIPYRYTHQTYLEICCKIRCISYMLLPYAMVQDIL
jgi:hypothetical protein